MQLPSDIEKTVYYFNHLLLLLFILLQSDGKYKRICLEIRKYKCYSRE